MRFAAGSRLGPYEITGPIGAGGMGEVYRARDTRLGREVAIKVLPADVSRDAERVARFKREACSSSALNHRNIVTVHDFTLGDGEAWLVMELIRGESLRELIKRGPLPLKKVISTGAGVADGLAAAHAAGIVHRDLKPENVMLTADGTPKILDFGLVKQALSFDSNSPTDMRVSESGMIMGTAAYMSPEQASGKTVDFRTDQFSLGMMLHEMVSGKHPFSRPTGVEMLAAIVNEEPPTLGDPYPEAFVAIVERCLAKNPDERYGATSDLAHDLRRLTDRVDRSVASTRVPSRRQWWPLAAVAAVALAAIVALLMARPERADSNSYQVTVATPEIAKVFRDEIALPVALSPDGRYLAVYGMNADGVPGLWLRDLRSGTGRQVAENAFSVGWSPDGKWIAYFAEGKLKTVPVDGGPPRIICDARPEGTPVWKGDNILFTQYSTRERGIFRVNASGGNPVLVAGIEPGRPSGIPLFPEFLPDGKHFLYLTLEQNATKGVITHELMLASLESGMPPRRVSAAIDSRAIYIDGNLLFVRDGTLLAQPFDPDAVRFTGEARPLVEDLHYFRSTGQAAFTVSANGVLAWRSAVRPSRLVWVDRTGTEVKVVATAAFQADGRISPDGRRYAVGILDPKNGVADVWTFDLDRDSSERATFRLVDEKAPVWGPDGTLYFRSDGSGGPPDIFQWTSDSGAGRLVHSGPGVEEPHDVSPDGKWMLFLDLRQSGAGDIKVLPLNPPGPPRPFVVTPFNELSPRFSPDGKWVAYQSDVSGRPEVHVRAFEGATVSTRISKDGGTRPRWRRDGKELFFLAAGGRIMSVAMDGGVAQGSPRMLFPAADAVDFEPSVDGSRFLVQLEERGAEPPIHMLINWPSRLLQASSR